MQQCSGSEGLHNESSPAPSSPSPASGAEPERVWDVLWSGWVSYPGFVPSPLAHTSLQVFGEAGEPALILCHAAWPWLKHWCDTSLGLDSGAQLSAVWAAQGQATPSQPDPVQPLSRVPE